MMQKILALHLALGRFPYILLSLALVLRVPKDQELVDMEWLRMDKGRIPQIDPPSLCRVLDIRIGLGWIMREMFCASSEAFLKHIKNRHPLTNN